ncbi:MAG: phosphotransferase [Bacillota bacterium]
MQEKVRVLLAENYALRNMTVSEVNRETAGVIWLAKSADSGKYSVKIIADYDRNEQQGRMLEHLHRSGVNVVRQLATRQGEFSAVIDGERFAVFEYIEGEPLVKRIATNEGKYLRLFGQALGELHRALALYHADSYETRNFAGEALNWALPILDEHCRIEWWRSNSPMLKLRLEALETVFAELPQQIVHRDAHDGNVIVAGDGALWFIDFEISLFGARIFDPAYVCTGMLENVFSMGNPDTVEAALAEKMRALQGFLAAYSETVRLTEREKTLVWEMMQIIQLICAANCYNHGNAEAGDKNIKLLTWIARNKIEFV